MKTFYVRCRTYSGEGYTITIEAPGPLVAKEIAIEHHGAHKVVDVVERSR